MRFLALVFLFFVVFSDRAKATENFEVSFKKVCDTKFPEWLRSDRLRYLKEAGYFPRGGDKISDYKGRIKNRPPSLIKTNPHEEPEHVLNVAEDLVNKIKSKTDEQIKKGSAISEIGSKCAPLIDQEKNLPAECQKFKNDVVPMLNERLKQMRVYLKEYYVDEGKANAPLHHTFALPENGKYPELKQSTEAEKAAMSEKSVSQEMNPKEKYLEILSQNPILLYFNGDKVTSKELANAFSKDGYQSQALEELDYIRNDKALLDTLKQIPEEKRNDYCAVAKALRENADSQYKLGKFVLNTTTLLIGGSSLLGLGAGIASDKALGSAMEAKKSANDMDREIRLCMKIPYQADGESNPVCDFKSIQENSDVIRNSIFRGRTTKELKNLEKKIEQGRR
jgi:hypothetical protein